MPEPSYLNQLPSLLVGGVNNPLIYNIIRGDHIQSNLSNPSDFIGHNIPITVVGNISEDGKYIVADYIGTQGAQ